MTLMTAHHQVQWAFLFTMLFCCTYCTVGIRVARKSHRFIPKFLLFLWDKLNPLFMNNSKFDPVQDELFPRGLTTLFDGFIYTFSSKPIQQGDLVMHVTDEFSEDGSLMYLICICVQENTDGTVQLRSSELLINAERQRSKRLIFTIPTDLTQPAFSN